MVDNIALPSDAPSSKVTEVNIFHECPYKIVTDCLMRYSINHINLSSSKHFQRRDFVQYVMQKKFPSSSKSVSLLSASVYIISRYVIANDLSPAAVHVMKRNIALNGLGDEVVDSESSIAQAKVQVNEGDAW